MELLAAQGQREDERESDGFVRGVVIAVVTDNKDEKGLGRVRVRLPWQEEGEASYWARLIVPMALAEQGVYFLPDSGARVLVAFESGDPTHPCVIGSTWEGNFKPPRDNADGKNDWRMIKTRANSELAFFDGTPPSVELKLEDGKHLLMDDSGIKLDDGKGNTVTIETSSNTITIKSGGALNLESKSISIKASAAMEIKASGTLTLNGKLVQIN